MKESTTSIIITVGIMIGIFVVFNYFFTAHSQWSLFYYPEGCHSCEEKWIIKLNAYKSQEQCRDFGYETQNKDVSRGDTFECGYKCKTYDIHGYICKKTIDF